MFLIGKRDYEVDQCLLREVIARWFFAVALTGRYSGSLESTMVEWMDNIDISQSAPSVYFPQYIHARSIFAEEREKLFCWYSLPDGWENMDYWEFLEERRKAMARVIRDGFMVLSRRS